MLGIDPFLDEAIEYALDAEDEAEYEDNEYSEDDE
jgi:hypothetical protein